MNKANPHSWLFKTALLSISLMLMLAANIAAALPLMAKTFASQSASAVDTLTTVPNLGIIIGIFVGELLTLKIGDKRTALSGLAIALFAGVLPMFVEVYSLVLGARFAFGLGVGMFNSLSISMISKYYAGDELASMMGYQSAVQSLGSSVMSFAVGYLLLFGWHATFLIYAIALPIFVLFLLVIPKDTPQTKEADKAATHQRVNGMVVMISVIAFLFYVAFMVAPVQLASLITARHFGTASQASMVLGVLTLVSMLTGLIYGQVYKRLHSAVLPVGLLIMTVGFLLVGTLSTFAGVTVGVIVIGIGFALAIPYIYTTVNVSAPKGSQNLASSLMLIMTNAGVFLSPILVNEMAGMVQNPGPIGAMLVSAGILGVLCAVCVGILWHDRRNGQKITN